MKSLLLSLIHAESEQQVKKILKKHWDNPSDWKLFGDDENNYSIIGNQQSKPEAALVEKIVNSVDATLLAECLKRGIDPKSIYAPKSIQQALIRYFGIEDGRLTNLSSKTRSLLADNIGFVATGKKDAPNYAIFDKGEGQSPNSIEDTILSLRKSNKLRIPFVQGKFNMGGTGVFRFCGEENLQVIVTKRHPLINDGDPTHHRWAFTVIRRENPKEGARSSNYKYLAINGEIPSFEADKLLILPSEYPKAYGEPMEWGTYIKMFDYRIGGTMKTFIGFDLYNKLSSLLPSIALPVKMYERREGYTAHSYNHTLSGLQVRIDEDRSGNIEEGFPTSGAMIVDSQEMKYSIYVFKKGRHENFVKDEGILFTINGQTHGYLPKLFFQRKSVGLSYLSDSILVLLDCSHIDGRSREDLFMNSRDRLASCQLRVDIEKELEEILKNHDGLLLLKEKRRQEEIEAQLQDQKPFMDTLKQILKKSPSLTNLFIKGLRLFSPVNTLGGNLEPHYEGAYFPTFFELGKKYTEESPKDITGKLRLDFKTDAANDYFDRDKDAGSFKLTMNGKPVEHSINLWNGKAHLNAHLEGEVGDLLFIRSEVSDTREKPLVEELYVDIVEPVEKQHSKGKETEKKPNGDGEGNTKPDAFSLPNIIEVGKPQWEAHGFNEHSALKVKDSGEGYDFFVNVDNINLLAELKTAKDIQTVQAKFKFGIVLIGLALLNDNKEEDVFKEIESVTSKVSPVIIPMIETLGGIDGN